MADLAVGLVSLSLQVCKELTWYIGGAKEAKNRSAQIATRIERLASLLERLDLIVKRRETSGAQGVASEGIVACAKALAEIGAKLGCERSVRGSAFRQQMRILGQRLAFPFKQDDVMFLKDVLGGVEHFLGLALQALELEVMDDTRRQVGQAVRLSQQNYQMVMDRVGDFQESSTRQLEYQAEVLESASNTSNQHMGMVHAELVEINTHLNPMAADLNAVSIAVPEMLSKLSRLEEKLDRYGLSSLSSSAIERDVSDFSSLATDMRKMNRKASRKKFMKQRCTCHGHSSTTKLLRWPVSITKTESSVHLPDCPYAAIEEAVTSLQVHFTMCSISLRRKAHVGLALSHGAGAATIAPVLKCNRIVLRTSPAFRLLAGFKRIIGSSPRSDAWEKPATQLLRLFQRREASPHDRLPNGMTLLHFFCYKMQKIFTVDVADPEKCIENYYAMGARILEYLPTQAMEKDDEGKTCIDYFVFGSHASLVEHFLDHGISVSMWMQLSSFGNDLAGFGLHPTPATEDSYECSEQMKALLFRDEEWLRRLIRADKTALEKREGGTPLYQEATRVGWRRGCEILLENGVEVRADAANPLLKFAVMAAKDDEGSIGVVQFWLDARSSLSQQELEHVGSLEEVFVDDVLAQANSRPALFGMLLSALVKQRKELQEIVEERNIEVRSDRLLDAQAGDVIAELEDRGVEVHPSLKPTTRSVYYVSGSLENGPFLDTLYRAGFRDVTTDDFNQNANERSLSPLFYLLAKDHGRTTPNRVIDSITWFLAHGTDLEEKWPRSDVTLGHFLGYRLGHDNPGLSYHSFYAVEKYPSFFASQITDGCKCPCSTNGCLFVTSFCKGMTTPNDIYPNTELLGVERAWQRVRRSWRNRLQIMASYVVEAAPRKQNRWLVTEVIRLAVFTELGIRHTCCDIEPLIKQGNPDTTRQLVPRYDDEELQVVQEEDVHLVELLEELVVKLNKAYDEHWLDVQGFLDLTFVIEMDRVLAQLREEDKGFEGGRREIGVVMHGGGGDWEESETSMEVEESSDEGCWQFDGDDDV
ncbi:hypothetical protein K458DRAFT_432023 [Lentithecium fluviatile CBS 122367]|uniref:Fungal N-terminal domain-containing protein n=1 Tax=Lentithecium fluviatile CBS 122367 TaxID=1168545 RepID=A0A6G1J106_9PLEO|nr:hypothetical protein K458DRAFT_432023 [Lentithecium fluviatile CBS 122367]